MSNMPPQRPAALHDHALDNLRYIRETMEAAGSFTSIPGWGGVYVGITALGTSFAAQAFVHDDRRRWMISWLIEAVVAAAIALAAMTIKCRRSGVALSSRPARKFFVSYFAPIIAGAMVTLLLARAGVFFAMPAVWLLLYGASFISSGAFSIRVIPVMGACYMALGIVAVFLPLPTNNILLGIGFGGLHIIFGLIIARSYGG